VHEKRMPFMAGEGDCPSALSRAPSCGVHRSAAKNLYKKGADQAQGLARKGSDSALRCGSDEDDRRHRENPDYRLVLEVFSNAVFEVPQQLERERNKDKETTNHHVRTRTWMPQCVFRALEYAGVADCSPEPPGDLGGVDTTRMQGRDCEAEDGEVGGSR